MKHGTVVRPTMYMASLDNTKSNMQLYVDGQFLDQVPIERTPGVDAKRPC